MSYMYASLPLLNLDRRNDHRLKLQLFLNEYVRDRPYRALALDISEGGLALQKLTEPVVPSGRIVNLELELPGTRETIWASAESRFESVGSDFHVSGLRFAAMARKHARLLSDYVRERRARLARLLGPVMPRAPYFAPLPF
jgi:c-di-GMP-binding flagellar brake protein YcgR